MGQPDYSTKDYINDADIFADAVNYYLYGGEQVIDPEALAPVVTNTQFNRGLVT